MIKMYSSILKDYGLKWFTNRSLYSTKLLAMKKIPFTESLFEKDISISRINLFDIDVSELSNFLNNLDNQEKLSIIKKAENALEGRLHAFSSIELDYGNPIDWHVNPITEQKHNAHKKWYDIPDFDNKVGDIKIIWEASRFTQFPLFARAYLITKDEKYYKGFSNQLASWLESNIYSYGPNYKCGQEATLRMINTLLAYSVFNSFDLIDIETEDRIYKIVNDSYKKVLSNFFYAHKCIENNHTFTEILGRIIGGWCINDIKEVEKSVNLMDLEIKKQFTKEGGFRQYSFNYQRFTLQIFEVLFSIENKLGHKIKNRKQINDSVLILYNLMSNQGFVPNYGSNDGALIFPFSVSDYRDYRPTLNTVYAQLNGKKLFEDGIYTEEYLWFCNSKMGSEPLPQKSMQLPEIGMYTFTFKGGMALIHLNDYKSRPAHMDQLHFELWYKNIDIFCDMGTFSYASELGTKLSKTRAHNTLKIIDEEQMDKYGAFMVYNWTTIDDIKYSNNYFKGTISSENNYKHTREVSKTEEGFEIIDIVNKERKGYEVIFHTPLDVNIVNGKIKLLKNKNIIVEIETNANISLENEFRSLYYLKKEKINKLVLTNHYDNKIQTNIKLI